MTNPIKWTASTLAIALLGGTSLAQAETINLRVGSGHPVGLLAYTETAHEWFVPELKKRVEEQTDHTINIQEFHAGQVAKVTEVLESTRDGLLDVGFISLVFEPSVAFAQNFTLYLPFNSPDAAIVTEAGKATFDEFPEMRDAFETDHNQVYLGGSCAANYGLGTNFGWQDLADLEGQKIAGAGTNLDWIVGATPVASNLNEAYQAMQSGVYDGYISAPTWWQTFNLNEVAPFFTATNFGAQYMNAVTINKQTYDRLPSEVQDILTTLGEEWGPVTAEVCANNNNQGLEDLSELGVEVTEISQEAQTNWANELSEFPQRMVDQAGDMPLAEILEFYMSKTEELGYTWPNRYQVGASDQ